MQRLRTDRLTTMKKAAKQVLVISIIIIVLCLKLGTENCSAQQMTLYSQYAFDRLIINPAYAGSSNIISGTLTYKNKLLGIKGAPETQVFSLHAPIQSKFMGVGIKVIHDKIGVTDQTGVTVVYSYHLGFANGKLSLGIEGGILNYTLDFANLKRSDQNDNAIPFTKESVIVPEVAFGIYYHSEKMYFGGSAYNLISSKLDKTGYDRSPIAKLSQHYFILNGYKIKMGESFHLEPSWLLKYVAGAPVQLDLNLNAIYKEMISLGVSYRTGDATVFMLQYSFKGQVRIGYAYDYTISKLSSYSAGSHEIMLNYTFKLLEPALKKITDPRYYF